MIQFNSVLLTKVKLHLRENIMRKATNVARENLVSLGTCFGKMTKSGKFRLHITALDFLAPYAKVGNCTIFENVFVTKLPAIVVKWAWSDF